MKLVFIHGAPATGKLTTARALLRAVPGRLFDNHVAIDVAQTVFDFGAPGFWELVHTVRCSVVEAAAKHDIPMLVTTYCYSASDRLQFEDLAAIMHKCHGEILPVHISCDRKEVLSRLGSSERAQRGKITTEQSLDEFNSIFVPAPAPRPNCLMLDSGVATADEMAATVVSRFGLCTPEKQSGL